MPLVPIPIPERVRLVTDTAVAKAMRHLIPLANAEADALHVLLDPEAGEILLVVPEAILPPDQAELSRDELLAKFLAALGNDVENTDASRESPAQP